MPLGKFEAAIERCVENCNLKQNRTISVKLQATDRSFLETWMLRDLHWHRICARTLRQREEAVTRDEASQT